MIMLDMVKEHLENQYEPQSLQIRLRPVDNYRTARAEDLRRVLNPPPYRGQKSLRAQASRALFL